MEPDHPPTPPHSPTQSPHNRPRSRSGSTGSRGSHSRGSSVGSEGEVHAATGGAQRAKPGRRPGAESTGTAEPPPPDRPVSTTPASQDATGPGSAAAAAQTRKQKKQSAPISYEGHVEAELRASIDGLKTKAKKKAPNAASVGQALGDLVEAVAVPDVVAKFPEHTIYKGVMRKNKATGKLEKDPELDFVVVDGDGNIQLVSAKAKAKQADEGRDRTMLGVLATADPAKHDIVCHQLQHGSLVETTNPPKLLKGFSALGLTGQEDHGGAHSQWSKTDKARAIKVWTVAPDAAGESGIPMTHDMNAILRMVEQKDPSLRGPLETYRTSSTKPKEPKEPKEPKPPGDATGKDEA